jgi:hypothetical protein
MFVTVIQLSRVRSIRSESIESEPISIVNWFELYRIKFRQLLGHDRWVGLGCVARYR